MKSSCDIQQRNIFSFYRKIGDVCRGKGFCVEYIRGEAYLSTSVGNSFNVYKCDKLNLVNVSESYKDEILKIESTKTGIIVTLHKDSICIWEKGKIIKNIFNDQDFVDLICLGDNIVTIDVQGNFILRQLPSLDITLQTSFPQSTLISWCHPPTYLNKIVLGFTSGTIQVWNLRTNLIVKEISLFNDSVSCLKESPVLDVIAIGIKSQIILINLRDESIIFRFTTSLSQISKISFENGQNACYIAVADNDSDIFVFDLNKKRFVHTIQTDGNFIIGMEFLNNKPILLTAINNNRITIWSFDNVDGLVRSIKSRIGNKGIIKKIRYFGESGLNILSCSSNNLRYFNLNRDEQCCDFSMGNKSKKQRDEDYVLPVDLSDIIDFCIEPIKEYFWENIISIHKKSPYIQTWKTETKKISKRIIPPIELFKFNTSAIALSSCGNLCVVGFSNGSLELFNVQSKSHRGSFIDNPSISSEIKGIVIDSTNYLCASIDSCYCRIWFFKSFKIKSRIKLSYVPTLMEINRQNRLIAVAGIGMVCVIDLETSLTVRKFPIDADVSFNDICLSSDGKWLLGCCDNSYTYIWDIPSSKLIDYMVTSKPISTLSLSFQNQVLSYAIQGESSIYCLINNMLYSDILIEDHSTNRNNSVIPKLTDEISDKLLKLSLLPEIRWRYLDRIDIIKERSKLTQPVKSIETVPFFIPTISGKNPIFDLSSESDPISKTKIRKYNPAVMLQKELEGFENDIEIFMKILLKYSPNELDVQIRTFDRTNILKFLNLLLVAIRSNNYFDFLQGILSLTLSIHSDIMIHEEFKSIVCELQQAVEHQSQSLNNLLNQSLSIISYLRSSITNF